MVLAGHFLPSLDWLVTLAIGLIIAAAGMLLFRQARSGGLAFALALFTAETGTQINVEDDGTIQIAATSGEAAQKAIRWIEGLTRDVEVGKEYLGKVTRIMNFGAFVEILPGKEGLVHISQLADYRVPRVEDVVAIGDELMVIVTEIDRMGRINLSRRAAMERHMARSGAGSEERS